VSSPSVVLRGVGKRYVKYHDTPTLMTHALQLRTRTRRTQLWAVRGADLEAQPGESVGIVGRNGSGKSTMLRMLAGVTAPTEGSVMVRGRIAPLISVGVGFHPELTGRENVFVNATVLGLTRRQIDQRFDEIVDFAEIGDFIHTPVKFYSSGMFVRLGFAVAVAVEPDVLLVDEVLAVGDIAFQLKCFDRMKAIQATGTTVIVVTHNLTALRNLCPRSVLLHEGRIRHDGDTAEAISRYHDILGESRELDASPFDPHEPAVDRAARIECFELLGETGERTAHLQSGEKATLRLDVRFERTVENPVLGLSISTAAGVQVYGDSTSWRNGDEFRAGALVRFEARVPVALATGSYTVYAGIRALNGKLLAPLPRPILFYVAGRSQVNGIADLHADLDVTRLADAADDAGASPRPTST
jgi:ABC-2 type transport system ATP-binding protein